MKSPRLTLLGFTALAFLLVSGTDAQQLPAPQLARLKTLLKLESMLSPEQRELLSRPVRDSLSLAHQLLDEKTNSGDDDQGSLLGLQGSQKPSSTSMRLAAGLRQSSLAFSSQSLVSNPVRKDQGQEFGVSKISHPEVGLGLSRLGLFSQLGSSSARCGESVVVGYNSGPAFTLSEIIPFLTNSNLIPSSSEFGVAFSKDGGETFTELPFLNAGPAADTTLPFTFNFEVGGNASVGCSDSRHFHAVNSPFTRFNVTSIPDSGGFVNIDILTGVGISTSSDGGEHWADPRPVVFKDNNHVMDSAWLAIDPQDARRMYVSYLDLDLEGTTSTPPSGSLLCPNSVRIGIEMVASSDGGRTWSSPSVIRQDCANTPDLQPLGFNGTPARIAVGASGKISVAYTLFRAVRDADGNIVQQNLQVNFRQSADHGLSFGPEIKISDIVQIGSGSNVFRPTLQGFFTTNSIPSLAADPALRSGKENLFIAWSDGRNNPQPDALGTFGTYNFGDILLSKSADGGLTWSLPQSVSPTPHDFSGSGRDQFLPAMAVDRGGTLAVCYYDRRNDPRNNALDRYCSFSQDHGQTFRDVRQTSQSWVPGENWDGLKYWLGEYESVTAPIFDGGTGFFGSFAISANNVTGIFGGSSHNDH